MNQQAFSSSLKAAKSTFFKTVLLSASILALGSASAYAEQLKLINVPGQGDYVQSTGGKAVANPKVYSQVAPVEGTGWNAATSFDAPFAYECTKSEKNTCEVEVEGNGITSSGIPDGIDEKIRQDLEKRQKELDDLLKGWPGGDNRFDDVNDVKRRL